MASFMKVGILVALVVVLPIVNLSEAAVYTVGNSIGWTILNSPNYTAWAAGKTFHVGDTLLFKYNKQFHNVLEVSKAGYKACKNDSALATYATGDDSVILKTSGHHYFICGFPGHCQAGQKVDIPVAGLKAGSPAPSVAPSVMPTVPPAVPPGSSPALNALPPAPSASAPLSAATLSSIIVVAMTVLFV